MRSTILIALLFISALLLGCTEKAQTFSEPNHLEIKNKGSCATDEDCVCGGIDTQSDSCFIGNVNYYEKYVDKSRQCPDFCSGIAGNLVVRCIEKKCIQMLGCIMDSDCDSNKCTDNMCEPNRRSSECISDTDCVKDGCSGELCRPKSAEPVFSTCDFRPEYECLTKTDCGCVDGECSWKSNSEYDECMQNI